MEEEGSANQLFIDYLEKLKKKCQERGDNRSVSLYSKALESLRLYPVPLRSASEAKKLKNIGDRVASDLDRCFQMYGPSLDTSLVPKVKPIEKVKRSRSDFEGCEDWEPWEWRPTDQVFVAVDARENELFLELQSLGDDLCCDVEKRNLGVGDIVWGVRNASKGERMLRHCAERKTSQDLWGSVKDGRYREQKRRLGEAGLKSVVYVVEGPLKQPKNNYAKEKGGFTLPTAVIEGALVSTAAQFVVYTTRDVKHTARYIATYSKVLKRMLKEGQSQGHVFPFGIEHFSGLNKKNANVTVSDIFARQLFAINGLSAKKVSTIVKRYPTPNALMDAYDQLETEEEKKDMLSDLLMQGGRRVGPKASEAVANAFLFA